MRTHPLDGKPRGKRRYVDYNVFCVFMSSWLKNLPPPNTTTRLRETKQNFNAEAQRHKALLTNRIFSASLRLRVKILLSY